MPRHSQDVTVDGVPEIRDYRPSDETSWLRCRVLGFLDTAYFDDVARHRPEHRPDLSVVAVDKARVVALADAAIGADGDATIETLAVHPEHRRRGLASAMLDQLLPRLVDAGADKLHAWTRDDEAALAWYAAVGFVETFRYLHVYASTPAEAQRSGRHDPRLMPRGGFFHAWSEHEDELRRTYERVHVCRRLTRALVPGSSREIPGHAAG